MNFPTRHLQEWFRLNRRDLPWRENRTPYRVWISEMMLQQTQVSVVIPYFQRWMEEFPTIEKLAQAPIERVIKCWEGLGYYSRARYLHQAAAYIMRHHEGRLPFATEDLQKIPGIGPYTLGAIQSFAFHQKAVAIDGNVKRVLTRFLGYDDDLNQVAAKKRVHEFANSILPDQEPWTIVEALIELGALVCTKKAQCLDCPLRNSCVAFKHGLQDVLPKKKKKQETIHLIRDVGVIRCGEKFLIEKREKKGVMADLYEFPYFDSDHRKNSHHEFEKRLNLSLHYQGALPLQCHTFTKYRVQLIPYLFCSKDISHQHLWKTKKELLELPFSSGHKKILNDLVMI